MRGRDLGALALGLLAYGGISPAAGGEEAASPAPPEVLHLGVDVSHHSGAVDWAQVREAGYAFAYLKATEGVDNPDPAFAEHWQAVREAGLRRGAYHFYVTEDDPEEQAKLFISHVRLEEGDLPPVVDVELIGHGTQPGLDGRLRRYLEILEAHYGVKPIIYTGPNFWDAHMTDDFGAYPLWIAEYGVAAPRLPRGWETWRLWQWEEDVQVPGVEKEADVSHLKP